MLNRYPLRYVHLKSILFPALVDKKTHYSFLDISVEFIKRRPTSDLELVFKDSAGIKHQSNKFKKRVPIYWSLDMFVHAISIIILRYWSFSHSYVRIRTSANLTIQRAFFNRRVAEILVDFKPDQFGGAGIVSLQGFGPISPWKMSFPLIVSQMLSSTLP